MQAQKILVQDLAAYLTSVCKLVGEELPVHVFMHRQGQIEISGTRAGKTYQQMIPDGDETRHVAFSAAFASQDLIRGLRRVMSRSKADVCEITMSQSNGNLKFGYEDGLTGQFVWFNAIPIRGTAHAFMPGNDGPLCKPLKEESPDTSWYGKYLAGLGW